MARGMFFAHMGWLLKNKSAELVAEGSKIDLSDLERDWVVNLQRRFNWFFVILMCWAVPCTCGLTQLTASTR